MEVVSACSLRVASRAWRSMHGAWNLTVICRATFLIEPGPARLAFEQELPNAEDIYQARDGRRVLRAPSDIVPFKPRADVLLVGSAFAPHGADARRPAAARPPGR